MNPTVDERLASVVRSLTEVILPHLPPEASLAQEQVQLAIGHLQILRAQFDKIPAFERGELHDSIALAAKLDGCVSGGDATAAALDTLRRAAAVADGSDVRRQHKALNEAVEMLVQAVARDGHDTSSAALSRAILEHEAKRTLKDREWYAPYGFDTL